MTKSRSTTCVANFIATASALKALKRNILTDKQIYIRINILVWTNSLLSIT